MTLEEQGLLMAENQQKIYNAGYAKGTQAGSIVRYSKQELTPEEQVQARQNINAISGDEVQQMIENAVGGGETSTATSGQSAYTKVLDRVEITEEDIAAAGDEGITILSIGSNDVDLSQYNDILIKVYVPVSTSLNSANGIMGIYATPTDKAEITGDRYALMKTGSSSIANASYFHYERSNYLSIRTEWTDDTFHHGLVIKNGYSGSYGYAGPTNGWNRIYEYFAKSKAHYFHIFGKISTNGDFKFPVDSYIEVYAR